MVRYRRSWVAGGTFFFTVNLHDRDRGLLVEHVDALRHIVQTVRRDLPFVIEAMVVLPDHWHAVWTMPPDDSGYAHRLRLIKARFTRYLLHQGVSVEKDARGEYGLWQRRFWEHTIRDARDLQAHVDYVHINPVKHGHATRAIGWPHSTIHRYVERGLLPRDWACEPQDGAFGE